MEAAYGKEYLSRGEYNAIISNSASFIKEWMRQNKLDLKDNYHTQFAIQKFMSEELKISKSSHDIDGKQIIEIQSHSPYGYDYDDYAGEKDMRNLFLTKCLATGYGQCSSMPAVYLVLAEALGVKAYLSLAPYYSFIKYPDNSGFIVNYEPTSIGKSQTDGTWTICSLVRKL